ncbi:MAG: T9SS type A sorting domain-containing protein [Bacteroidetes bacterium]|nr:MAG: T9SS type A sorting domain-containing protein [Bacteroidota bacterium]
MKIKFFILFFLPSILFAQAQEWVNITCGNYIHGICKYKNIIWVGTMGGGLIKIDTITSETIFYNKANSILPDNFISSLVMDPSGILYIGTHSKGLIIIKDNNWKFYNSTNSILPNYSINDMAIDKKDTLWIAFMGGGLVSIKDTTIKTYNRTNSLIPSNNLFSIAVDNDNSIWLGTTQKIINFTKDQWNIYEPGDYLGVGGIIYDIVIDSLGNKWFGSDFGLIKYDNTKFTGYTVYNSEILNSEVRRMIVDKDNNKWLSFINGKLQKFTDSTWITIDSTNSKLPTYEVISFMVDSNIIWFGTYKGLIKFDKDNWIYYNTSNSGLTGNYINAICFENDSTRWFSMSHPLDEWFGAGIAKLSGNKWEIFDKDNSQLPTNSVLSLAIDKHGNKWIGMYEGGIAKFNNNNWQIFDTTISILLENVYSIADEVDDIWVGTQFTTFLYKDNNWKFFTDDPGGTVCSIAIDSSGNKWFCYLSFGIAKYDGEKWEHYSKSGLKFPFDDAWRLTIDNDNNIWAGSIFHGLTKFNEQNYIVYDTNNSEIPDNRIYALCFDNYNNLWIGTRNGLAKFDGINWTIYNETNSKLPVNEVTAIAIDKYDNKWIGTAGGGIAVYREGGVILDVEDSPDTLLNQNYSSIIYPNPVNNTATIEYNINSQSRVSLKIFDISGTEISTLVNKIQSQGSYKIPFEANLYNSGVYYYQLKTINRIEIGKMIIIK